MRLSTPLHRLFIAAIGLIASLQLFATSATAADSEREPDDPPERVARLSYLLGDVALQTEDDDQWSEAGLNHPLTSGDRLRLERNARVELQAGALDLQLGEHSDFSFLELTDDVAQIRLTEGAIYISVRRLRSDETIEVDTPHAAVAISKPGEYSIALTDKGATTLVKTYTGECEITDHRQTVTLKSREQANFVAADREGQATPIVEAAGTRTAFDTWAHERNQRRERSASTRYVSPDVIGYEDLDDYGDWVSETEYGHVWYPRRVAVDWSPYREGHWAWISPWGWTWIDDAPWGFAPFHYGRWAFVRNRWGWVPGPLHIRPVYAPALVAWVGSGPPRSGVSVSIAFGGGIGWFPLAPREIYVPSYRCSRRHIHNVNYANTVVINNVYINRAYNNRSIHFEHANRNVRDAVTAVRPDAFAASRSVREHRLHVDSRELNRWETRNALPEISPQRDSRRSPAWNPGHGADRNRQVVTRRAPSERIDGRARTDQQASFGTQPARRDEPRSSNSQMTWRGAPNRDPARQQAAPTQGQATATFRQPPPELADRSRPRLRDRPQREQSPPEQPAQNFREHAPGSADANQSVPGQSGQAHRRDFERPQRVEPREAQPDARPRDTQRWQPRGGNEGFQPPRQHTPAPQRTPEPQRQEPTPQQQRSVAPSDRGQDRGYDGGGRGRQRFSDR